MKKRKSLQKTEISCVQRKAGWPAQRAGSCWVGPGRVLCLQNTTAAGAEPGQKAVCGPGAEPAGRRDRTHLLAARRQGRAQCSWRELRAAAGPEGLQAAPLGGGQGKALSQPCSPALVELGAKRRTRAPSGTQGGYETSCPLCNPADLSLSQKSCLPGGFWGFSWTERASAACARGACL